MSGSLVTPELRARVRGLITPIALGLARVGLSPNALTVIGFLIACVAAIAAGAQAWLLAGLLTIFGGVFDLFDGAVARATGKVSKLGAFLDSTFDRWGEGVVYLGIVWGAVDMGLSRTIVLAAAAMVSAFMVSYTRAKAESLGFTSGTGMAAVGLAPREVRIVDPHDRADRRRPRRDRFPVGLRHVRRRHGLPARCTHPRGGPRADRGPRDHHHHPANPPHGPAGRPAAGVGPGRPAAAGRCPSSSHATRAAVKQGVQGADMEQQASTNDAVPVKRDRKIRVAIVGVGNCASSLVQGRYYYENAKAGDFVPGLMHVQLGDYHISDVEFVAAFDVDKEKVGKDLSEAIFSGQNNTFKFMDVPHIGVNVDRGMTHDGLGKYLSQVIEKAPGPTADVVRHPQGPQGRRDGLVPPRREREATKWYVEQALQAGVGFVNAIPVFIGREPYWQRRFAEQGLPVIGDDIKSQVGATITHRVLTRLFMDRGVRIDRTYQLNFGGNTDFLNMLERERLESKKISKTNAVTSMLDYDIAPGDIHVGPSDYVPWLKDRKWCHIRIEGTTFGDVPLNIELKLEVWDSPNSAGVIIDAIRCLRIGLDRGLKGTLVAPSSYFMKSPPLQIHDDIAYNRVEAFIRGDDNETLVGAEESKKDAKALATASRTKVAAPK